MPLSGEEPANGPADALVTIVELSDFECPYCAKAAPTLQQLKTRYGDHIRIVWMNNPLPFHTNVIARQQAIATTVKPKGTPNFFINGRNLRGAQPLTRFALVIDEELRHANGLVEAGLPQSELYAALIENGIREVEAPPPASPPAAPAPTPSRVYDIPLPKKPRAKGPVNAEVVIQEFSDFQCPVCRRVTPTLERVLKEYGPKVRIVFRDYPLDFHPDAHLSAEAAREVFAQKGNAAFWKYHDILLQNQHALSRADLEGYAKRLGGIDMKRFQKALDSRRHSAAVDADIAVITKAGARIGTPAFFFNGKLAIQGAYPFETFKAAIDAELA